MGKSPRLVFEVQHCRQCHRHPGNHRGEDERMYVWYASHVMRMIVQTLEDLAFQREEISFHVNHKVIPWVDLKLGPETEGPPNFGREPENRRLSTVGALLGERQPTCICGNQFLPDAMFCRKCGTKRPEGTIKQMRGSIPCIKCKNALMPDAIFCRKCGTKRLEARITGGAMLAVPTSPRHHPGGRRLSRSVRVDGDAMTATALSHVGSVARKLAHGAHGDENTSASEATRPVTPRGLGIFEVSAFDMDSGLQHVIFSKRRKHAFPAVNSPVVLSDLLSFLAADATRRGEDQLLQKVHLHAAEMGIRKWEPLQSLLQEAREVAAKAKAKAEVEEQQQLAEADAKTETQQPESEVMLASFSNSSVQQPEAEVSPAGQHENRRSVGADAESIASRECPCSPHEHLASLDSEPQKRPLDMSALVDPAPVAPALAATPTVPVKYNTHCSGCSTHCDGKPEKEALAEIDAAPAPPAGRAVPQKRPGRKKIKRGNTAPLKTPENFQSTELTRMITAACGAPVSARRSVEERVASAAVAEAAAVAGASHVEVPASPADVSATQNVRAEVYRALLAAADNGKLQKALQEDHPEEEASDDMLQQCKGKAQRLLDMASKSGALTAAVESAQSAEKMQSLLKTASESGALSAAVESALASQKQVVEESTSILPKENSVNVERQPEEGTQVELSQHVASLEEKLSQRQEALDAASRRAKLAEAEMERLRALLDSNSSQRQEGATAAANPKVFRRKESQAAPVCSCGNAFVCDAVFCRKCGAKRPEVPLEESSEQRQWRERAESAEIRMCGAERRAEIAEQELANAKQRQTIAGQLSVALAAAFGKLPAASISQEEADVALKTIAALGNALGVEVDAGKRIQDAMQAQTLHAQPAGDSVVIQQAQVRLDVDFAQAMQDQSVFESSFKEDMAAALGIVQAAITVLGVKAGSVIVDFSVRLATIGHMSVFQDICTGKLPAPDFSNLSQLLGCQVKASYLRQTALALQGQPNSNAAAAAPSAGTCSEAPEGQDTKGAAVEDAEETRPDMLIGRTATTEILVSPEKCQLPIQVHELVDVRSAASAHNSSVRDGELGSVGGYEDLSPAAPASIENSGEKGRLDDSGCSTMSATPKASSGVDLKRLALQTLATGASNGSLQRFLGSERQTEDRSEDSGVNAISGAAKEVVEAMPSASHSDLKGGIPDIYANSKEHGRPDNSGPSNMIETVKGMVEAAPSTVKEDLSKAVADTLGSSAVQGRSDDSGVDATSGAAKEVAEAALSASNEDLSRCMPDTVSSSEEHGRLDNSGPSDMIETVKGTDEATPSTVNEDLSRAVADTLGSSDVQGRSDDIRVDTTSEAAREGVEAALSASNEDPSRGIPDTVASADEHGRPDISGPSDMIETSKGMVEATPSIVNEDFGRTLVDTIGSSAVQGRSDNSGVDTTSGAAREVVEATLSASNEDLSRGIPLSFASSEEHDKSGPSDMIATMARAFVAASSPGNEDPGGAVANILGDAQGRSDDSAVDTTSGAAKELVEATLSASNEDPIRFIPDSFASSEEHGKSGLSDMVATMKEEFVAASSPDNEDLSRAVADIQASSEAQDESSSSGLNTMVEAVRDAMEARQLADNLDLSRAGPDNIGSYERQHQVADSGVSDIIATVEGMVKETPSPSNEDLTNVVSDTHEDLPPQMSLSSNEVYENSEERGRLDDTGLIDMIETVKGKVEATASAGDADLERAVLDANESSEEHVRLADPFFSDMSTMRSEVSASEHFVSTELTDLAGGSVEQHFVSTTLTDLDGGGSVEHGILEAMDEVDTISEIMSPTSANSPARPVSAMMIEDFLAVPDFPTPNLQVHNQDEQDPSTVTGSVAGGATTCDEPVVDVTHLAEPDLAGMFDGSECRSLDGRQSGAISLDSMGTESSAHAFQPDYHKVADAIALADVKTTASEIESASSSQGDVRLASQAFTHPAAALAAHAAQRESPSPSEVPSPSSAAAAGAAMNAVDFVLRAHRQGN